MRIEYTLKVQLDAESPYSKLPFPTADVERDCLDAMPSVRRPTVVCVGVKQIHNENFEKAWAAVTSKLSTEAPLAADIREALLQAFPD